MEIVQVWLFGSVKGFVSEGAESSGGLNWNVTAQSVGDMKRGQDGIWQTDVSNAGRKLNPSRLQDQMFAYTVTNQVVDTFTEVGLPFLLRAWETFWGNRSKNKGKGKGGSGSIGRKKRVVFEDEVRSARGGGVEHEAAGDEEKEREEREFLEEVRSEVALPDYELFGDYSEMVTQFGYVVLWSGIWPLAPGEPAIPHPH